MADLSGETGLTPSTFCPITGGRVYLVDGPPAVTSYGGSSSEWAWRLLVQTELNGPMGAADAWTIIGTIADRPSPNVADLNRGSTSMPF